MDHALPVEAGHWEGVTESKRTLVLLHGGHHIHVQGFGSSEAGPVCCSCNSEQGHGGWWADGDMWLPGTAGGQQPWCRRDPPVLQPELHGRSAPGSKGSPSRVSVLRSGPAECLVIRCWVWKMS